MFFYLAFPLLLIGIGKNWPWKLAGTIGIIGGYALAARIFAIPPTSPDPLDLTITYLTYASPLFRSFEFVLGMAVYVHWKRMNAAERVGTRIEAAMIAGLVLWLVVGWHHAAKLFEREPTLEIWYASAGSSLVCAAAIYVFAGGRGVIGRLLSLKAFVWLGEISFALYMCHQIIMKWLFLQNLEGKLTLPPLWVAILICIAAAAALHHLVEKPAQWALNDLGRSLRSRRSAKLAAQLQ
jgi:peptidoglycan/LPS O-acetylase OafA/YrhL